MRRDPDALMLFAAGFGTRMRPLTDGLPKPLIEVAGIPLIDRAIRLARAAGIETLVANAHYRADQLSEHLSGGPVTVLKETPEILDTGGGLKAALPHLGEGEAVFTLNTDAIWTGINPLAALRDAWDPDRMDALLMLAEPARATGHAGSGDFVRAKSGRLSPGPGLVFTGAQIIRTDALTRIPDRVFSMWRLWDIYLAQGHVLGIVHPGGWCDVGAPAGIPAAEALLHRANDV